MRFNNTGLSGGSGDQGQQGCNGWSPVPSIITNAGHQVIYITWEGGTGTKPRDGYISDSGLTDDIADAVDISGMQGEPGESGFSPEVNIAVDAENEYRLTVKTAAGEFTTANLKGANGENGYTPLKGVDYFDGVPGEPGKAATIEIGNVVTVESDEPASVVNSGSESATVFNFTIPRGRDGYTPYRGANGNWWIGDTDTGVAVSTPGATGATGSKGDNGLPGTDGYTVLLDLGSWLIPAGTSNAIASSVDVSVIAFKGATQIAATIGMITGQVTGLSTSIASNGTTTARFTVSVATTLSTESGVLTIPVTVDGKTFTKKFSWALALMGAVGATGEQGIPGGINYGVCSAAADTATKTVTVPSFALATGQPIKVKFTYTNTAASPMLNVNGTGAKEIWCRGIRVTNLMPYLLANHICDFVYTGDYYELVADNVPAELSWCAGYFQNTSLAANTFKTLTPIAERGDTSLVSGNMFVAKERGLYVLSLGYGACPSGGTLITLVAKNFNAEAAGAWNPNVWTWHSIPNSMNCPFFPVSDYLEVNDYFMCHLKSSVAQSTIQHGGTICKFTFARIV